MIKCIYLTDIISILIIFHKSLFPGVHLKCLIIGLGNGMPHDWGQLLREANINQLSDAYIRQPTSMS